MLVLQLFLIPLVILLSLVSSEVISTNTTITTTSFATLGKINKTIPLKLSVNEASLPAALKSSSSSSATYQKIRIQPDYDNLSQGTTQLKTYIKKELLPAVIDYFQAALGLRQPLTSNLKLPSTITTVCGLKTPKTLQDGIKTDFYLLISSVSDSTSNWVASAGICYTSATSNRPLIAHMVFNVQNTKPPGGDPLLHEKNLHLTIHEMFHALGFISTSFPSFIDEKGNTRTGHIKNATLDGKVRMVLDVEPLTTKLRAHFGCSTLPGAFLENDGDSGTIGSHFEKRHFLHEVMTSGVIPGLRISQFSLAVLEGSGWYKPDYSYADPFHVGSGEGCGFLYSSCKQKTILSFDDFCEKDEVRGCSPVGNIGGTCESDSRSDGCKYYKPIVQFSCENPAAISYARFPSKEVFSRKGESRCFSGDLTTKTADTQTTFCFKYYCTGTGTSTKLLVYIGNVSVICKAAGPLSVNGYNGKLNCPDPLNFCSTVGKSYCPQNCMGRGRCVSNTCVCKSEYKGIDCSMNQ